MITATDEVVATPFVQPTTIDGVPGTPVTYDPLAAFPASVPAPVPPFPPTIVEVLPPRGAEIAPDTALTWTFDRPMDPESFRDAFRLSPALEATLIWQDDRRVSLIPEGLVPVTRYVAGVAMGPPSQDDPQRTVSGATVDGMALNSLTRFVHDSTVVFNTLGALRVTSISPVDGAQDVRADTPILLTFNRAVVSEACIGHETDSARCPEVPLTVSPGVMGRGTWIHTSIYRYDVPEGWATGQRYVLSLSSPSGSEPATTPSVGFAAVDGATLEAPMTWAFDTARPRVVDLWPASGSQNAALTVSVGARFGTPMDRAASAAAFSLTGPSGELIAGSVRWSDGDATLTFTPSEPLATDSTYVARIDQGARAIDSAPLEMTHIWWFRTVATPRLVEVRTAEGQLLQQDDLEQVAPLPLQLQFEGGFERDHLPDAVRVSPAPLDHEVFALYDEETGVMSVSWRHLPATGYCLSFDEATSDRYGQALAPTEPYCLVTEDLPPSFEPAAFSGRDVVARSVWGAPDALTLDAGSAPEITFLVTNIPSVQFELHAVEPDRILLPEPVNGNSVRTWTQAFDPAPNRAEPVTVTLQPGSTPLRPGLYNLTWRVTATGDEGEVRIALVDRSMTLKLSGSEALVWVADLASGTPVSRTAVRLLDRDGLLLAGGTTDIGGVVRLPLVAGDGRVNGDVAAAGWQVAAVVGEPGTDGFGFVGSGWYGATPPWSYDISVVDPATPASAVTFIRTDRRVYRRGEAVRYAGFMRLWRPAELNRGGASPFGYLLPDAEGSVSDGYAELVLRDGQGEIVVRQALQPWDGSDTDPGAAEADREAQDGLFSGTLRLPEDLAPGSYVLDTVDAGPGSLSAVTLTIIGPEPATTVYVEPLVDAVVVGDVARYVVTVQTLSTLSSPYAAWSAPALPSREVPVSWELVAAPASPPMLPFDAWQPIGWRWGGEGLSADRRVIVRGHGVTDDEGRLVIELPTDTVALHGESGSADTTWSLPGFREPQAWTLRAVVSDADVGPSADAPSGEDSLLVYPAEWVIGIRPNAWIFRSRQRVTLELAVADWGAQAGAELVAGVELDVQLIQRTWDAASEGEVVQPIDTVVVEQTVTTGVDGRAAAAFVFPAPGTYLVTARAVDEAGRSVTSVIPLWVGGGQAPSTGYPADGDGLRLVLDADLYREGDVARLLVLSDGDEREPQHVLLTVEREGVYSVEHHVLDAADPTIDIPILAEYAPNVIVSCVIVRPATPTSPGYARVGFVRLNVDLPATRLHVEVVPEEEAVRPGDRASFVVRVTDSQGRPVEADLLVGLEDARSAQQPGDRPYSVSPTLLQELFYGTHRLGVATAVGLHATPGVMSSTLVRFPDPPGRGREGVSSQSGGEDAFDLGYEGAVFWHAWLTTDDQGEARLTVDVPRRLAIWTLAAYAVTADTQVGEGRATISVSQPLFIEPLTPHFVSVGDQVMLAARVHNRTSRDLTVDVWLEVSDGMELLSRPHMQVSIPAGEATRVTWACLVTSTEAPIRPVFGAQSGDWVDVRPPAGIGGASGLPVFEEVRRDVSIVTGVVEEAGSRVEVVVPRSQDARLAVRVDASLLAVLVQPTEALSHGELSAERLTTAAWASRLLGAAVGYDALRRSPELIVDETVTERAASHAAAADEALERLYVRQNADGGWGWQVGAASTMRDTAYVVHALLTSERAGLPVSAAALGAALDDLQTAIAQEVAAGDRRPDLALGVRLLVEAGRSWPEGVVSALYADRELLGVAGRGHLALALGAVDRADNRVTTLLSELRARVTDTVSGAYWETLNVRDRVTSVQATGIALDALAHLAPDDALVPLALRWLLLNRGPDGWATPYESAWVLSTLQRLVLSDDPSAPGEAGALGAVNWQVALNEAWIAGGLPGDVGSWTSRMTLADGGATELREDTNLLQFVRDAGPGDLYYALELSRPRSAERAAEGEGRRIDVLRQFCRVHDPAPDLPATAWPLCEPVTGVRVGDLVEVRLLLVIPETRDALRLEVPYPAGFVPLPGDYEIGHGSVVVYMHDLPAGTHAVSYIMRAEIPGRYRARPAVVEEIFFPEIWASSSVHTLEVWPTEP